MTEIEQFRCELVSWNRIQHLGEQLGAMIRRAGARPDIVVAIARGGFVPARILCDQLDVGELTSIRIVHYLAGAQRRREATLAEPLNVDIRAKRVLIVDDVSDTGDTLEIARAHVEALDPSTVEFAVLHHKKVASVEPDYYAQRIIKWRWIIYPWAMMEDIGGFLDQMDPPPCTPQEASNRLIERYRLHAPERVVRAALQEVHNAHKR